MSVIFGIRKPAGAAVSKEELESLARSTRHYVVDDPVLEIADRIGMGLQPFRTHSRSNMETGPVRDPYGDFLALDGRLDNYRDLCRMLALDEDVVPDSRIALAAYLRWGRECFSHFIGDWAIALWSEREQTLYLARDHAGTRTLYFENRDGTLVWSTYIDTFLTDTRNVDIDEGYAACYLSVQPVGDLTPYRGIRSVLPAHYLVAQNNTLSKAPHWQWMRKAQIRYKTDKEYEEHFLALMRQSVARRDDVGDHMLADLSGGMDSTAIVCISDDLRKRQGKSVELIDTISFYDDSEPSWNEMPYVSAVESSRGKAGIHLASSFADLSFEPHDAELGRYVLPGADSSTLAQEKKLESVTSGREHRVRLSGFGGDELLGGVPNPKSELADYLVRGQFKLLAKQTTAWCLADRSPFLHMFFGTAAQVIDLYRYTYLNRTSMPPWIQARFRHVCTELTREEVVGESRTSFLPTNIANGRGWWPVLETLPHLHPGILARPEYRYPYLDRDLVEYLFSIEREQLLRPGRRRSLMRRALKGIVPSAVLERRRKGYRFQGPLSALLSAEDKLRLLLENARIVERGFVAKTELIAGLELTIRNNDLKWWRALTRAITFELWLRGLVSAMNSLCRAHIHVDFCSRTSEQARSAPSGWLADRVARKFESEEQTNEIR